MILRRTACRATNAASATSETKMIQVTPNYVLVPASSQRHESPV